MRALLDINVLLALLDQAHVHHRPARNWFTARADHGWASCPLTQNGFVRIISQPSYPKPVSVPQAIELLAGATSSSVHEFWPADASILDPLAVIASRVHGPRQVTDLYLLALAVRHGGCLATFDSSIPVSAVLGATAEHLVVL